MLIAITLVSATAVSGFVFGMFGTYTNTAQLQLVSSICSTKSGTCTVSFQNTGTATGKVVGISISFGGTGYDMMTGCTELPVAVTPGSGPTAVTGCTFSGTATTGEQYTLSSMTSNGGQPLGAGIFSA